jgi:L-2,4-diaminobutyrate decarboxylase
VQSEAARRSGLGATRGHETLTGALEGSLVPGGLGMEEATRRLHDEVLAACLRVDHPAFLAFVPTAPDPASVIADQAISAAAVYAGDWVEASGALHAERQVVRLLASLAGFPLAADGTFVSGGSAGTLSALVAARHRWRAADGGRSAVRGIVLASEEVHSSVAAAARVMDVDLVTVPADAAGRLTGGALAAWIERVDVATTARVLALVATVGTTDTGAIDDLPSLATIAREHAWWLHVDGAYGLACLLSERLRPLVAGIEHADSFIVDPHKWLFAPYDACALVYRDPSAARAAHGQRAGYLEVLRRGVGSGDGIGDGSGDGFGTASVDDRIDPSDLAFQLSRRPRGVPLWFGLATHGTDHYARAVEHGVDLARWTAEQVRAAPHLELLVEPALSVVIFRRHGWDASTYAAWSTELLARGTGYVAPTVWRGAPALRLCFVNPATTTDHIAAILAALD